MALLLETILRQRCALLSRAASGTHEAGCSQVLQQHAGDSSGLPALLARALRNCLLSGNGHFSSIWEKGRHFAS